MCRILIAVCALTFLLNSNVAAADSTSMVAPKSRNTALAKSQLWTLMPVAVGIALMTKEQTKPVGACIGSLGLVLGPGVGHAYAGKMGRFWNGVAIRGTVASLSAAMLIAASENSSMDDGIATALLALAVGGGICLVSAIYDISNVGTSVDDYNSEHGFIILTLKPTYYGTHKAAGLMLTLSF